MPIIEKPLSFEEAINTLSAPAIICYEDESKISLLERLPTIKTNSLAVFIGPEGGYDPAEIAFAKQKGVIPVTLGQNILRAETAAAAACWAALQ